MFIINPGNALSPGIFPELQMWRMDQMEFGCKSGSDRERKRNREKVQGWIACASLGIASLGHPRRLWMFSIDVVASVVAHSLSLSLFQIAYYKFIIVLQCDKNIRTILREIMSEIARRMPEYIAETRLCVRLAITLH